MSFLFPLFLLAGLALAIPILIHLFHLRRYKTVFFPNTRFLKNIQLQSKKQNELKYKALLALRLLFLALLILAFAQPFFKDNDKDREAAGLQAIYLDNSYSMAQAIAPGSVRRLIDIARTAAIRQVQTAPPGARFLLLTNDRRALAPQGADAVIAQLGQLEPGPASRTATEIVGSLQSWLMQQSSTATLSYYSDFQRTQFSLPPAAEMNRIRFAGIPVSPAEHTNVYIDTAYFSSPVMEAGTANQLIVKTRYTGNAPRESPVLQLSANGQVKNAATVAFENKESLDTLAFQSGDAGWQKIALQVKDADVHFDDTFRIAARPAPGLGVLVLNGGQANPYLQALTRSYSGFRISQEPAATPPADWTPFNLVILNDAGELSSGAIRQLKAFLDAGKTVCWFPALRKDPSGLNASLAQLTEVRLGGPDTARQTVAGLQTGSELVKDLFVNVPENVQLPVVNWHYLVKAGLSASQQSVMSFRNGDPFLARYPVGRGQLYLCASGAESAAGNFAGSYFFVPFIFQMASQSRGSDLYASTAGSGKPLVLALNNANERNMVHLYGPGLNAIPRQTNGAGGLNVYLDELAQQPGFYELYAQGQDTVVAGLNASRAESSADYWDLGALRSAYRRDGVRWEEVNRSGGLSHAAQRGPFPLWKVCAILALLMLLSETLLLSRKQQIQAA